jgi:hypothetical protein
VWPDVISVGELKVIGMLLIEKVVSALVGPLKYKVAYQYTGAEHSDDETAPEIGVLLSTSVMVTVGVVIPGTLEEPVASASDGNVIVSPLDVSV